MSAVGYFEPRTVGEAIDLLATHDRARCLAGGQTLVAMMNAGLFEPSVLISLRRIAELTQIERNADGSLWIGSMVRHATLAQGAELRDAHATLREAARSVAHPAIRNMGTLGGSICHADPNSDYPAAIVAAEANIEIVSTRGQRSVSAQAFFLDYMTAQLEPDELVTRIWLPPSRQGSTGVYEKFVRVDGDYATVSVALVLQLADKKCVHVRIALGACGMTPISLRAAEERLVGGNLSSDEVRAAAALLVEASNPVDDVRGTADYRRMLIPNLLSRAIDRACRFRS